jgi:hypothetical protein
MMRKFYPAFLVTALVLGLAGGCASNPPGMQPLRPGASIAEYREITDLAARSIQSALDAVKFAAAQPGRCSPATLDRLNTEVQHLQVGSVQLRARAQAILTRGDQYFENWQETLSRVEDERQRAAIARRKPALQQSFEKLKVASAEFRDAFKPFLDDARAFRNSVEEDPESIAEPQNRDRAARIDRRGNELLAQLSAIRTQLRAMEVLVKR